MATRRRDSRVTRVNLARRVTFISKMAIGECRRVWRVLAKWLVNVGESGKPAQHGLANVGKSGEYSPSPLADVGASAHNKIGRFKHK